VLLRLVNKAYHISVVIATTMIWKGGVKLYKKFSSLLEESNKTAYQVSPVHNIPAHPVCSAFCSPGFAPDILELRNLYCLTGKLAVASLK